MEIKTDGARVDIVKQGGVRGAVGKTGPWCVQIRMDISGVILHSLIGPCLVLLLAIFMYFSPSVALPPHLTPKMFSNDFQKGEM